MQIFHRRPLFFCCALLILAHGVGLLLPGAGRLILGGLCGVGAAAYAVLTWRRRQGLGRAILAVAAAVLVCGALLQSHVTFAGPESGYLRSLEQTAVTVEGTVTDRRGTGGNLTSYCLELETVNGRPTRGLAVLTCYYVSELQPGYTVELEATLIPLSEAVGDGYDATALLGDGYVAGLLSEDESAVTVLERDNRALSVRAGRIRRTLAARLNLLTGDAARGLPAALLLGDRADLADDTRRDFARAGVSHLLAISGLHMTLLFGLLEVLLRLLRVPQRVRAILLGTGAVGYLWLLGFPPSATRAAIMLGVTYLSHLFSERSDPLTALGVAGACILAVTPYAAADAGFWMSFLATLGILTMLPLVNGRLKRTGSVESVSPWQSLRRGAVWLICGICVGLIAMSFTLAVVAAVIGELGILSPVSTLVLTPFCAVIAVLTLACLPCMGTPAGYVLGSAVQAVSSLMADLAAWMGEPSWAVVSLRHPAVVPLSALMLGALLILLSVRLPARRRWMVILPLLLGWTAIGGVLGLHSLATRDRITVTYLQPSTASDGLVMVAGQEGLVCDLSNGSLSSMTAMAREAERLGATELSVFMLTHYHTRTSGALSAILARETVRELWMPTPETPEDYYLLLACQEKAELAGVPVYLYRPGEALQVFDEGTLTLETTSVKRSVQPVLLVSLDVSHGETGKDSLVYCGSAVFESDLAETAAQLVLAADTVIFGSHGPLFKAPYGAGLDLANTDEIVFSAYGDAAAWLDPSCLLADTPMWVGQKRLILYKD